MLIVISVLLDRMPSKAFRLLENVTTNLAENWMNIRYMFDARVATKTAAVETRKAQQSYGTDALDVVPDLSSTFHALLYHKCAGKQRSASNH